VYAFLPHFCFCFFQLKNAERIPFSEKLGTAGSRRSLSLQGMGVGGKEIPVLLRVRKCRDGVRTAKTHARLDLAEEINSVP